MSDIKSAADYKEDDIIGSGAQGVVRRIYRLSGKDKLYFAAKRLNTPLSELKPDEKEAVLKGVEATHRLEHANIVRNYNSFIVEDHLVLITEYCPGGTLHTAIQKRSFSAGSPPFPPEQIRSWFTMLVHAVKFLHDNRIVHCDIKAGNIYIGGALLKLGDFGLAKLLTSRTAKGSIRGTPTHMAPEVITDSNISYKSDIWSLGVILYQMVTLKLPFQHEGGIKELIRLITSEHYAPIDRDRLPYDERLYDLIDKMLDKNPATRLKISEVLNHPFLIAPAARDDPLPSVAPPPSYFAAIRKDVDRMETEAKEREGRKTEKTAKLMIVAIVLSAFSILPLSCSIPAYLKCTACERLLAYKWIPDYLKRTTWDRLLAYMAIVFGAVIIVVWVAIAIYYGSYSAGTEAALRPEAFNAWRPWIVPNPMPEVRYPTWSTERNTIPPNPIHTVPIPIIHTIPVPIIAVSQATLSSQPNTPPPKPTFSILAAASTCSDAYADYFSHYSNIQYRDAFAAKTAADAASIWSNYVSKCQTGNGYYMCFVATSWEYYVNKTNSIVLRTNGGSSHDYLLIPKDDCTKTSIVRLYTKSQSESGLWYYRLVGETTNIYNHTNNCCLAVDLWQYGR